MSESGGNSLSLSLSLSRTHCTTHAHRIAHRGVHTKTCLQTNSKDSEMQLQSKWSLGA